MNRLLTRTVKFNETENPQGAGSTSVLALFAFIVLIGGAALWWQLTTSVPDAGTERHLHNFVATSPRNRLLTEPTTATEAAPQTAQTAPIFSTEALFQATPTPATLNVTAAQPTPGTPTAFATLAPTQALPTR